MYQRVMVWLVDTLIFGSRPWYMAFSSSDSSSMIACRGHWRGVRGGGEVGSEGVRAVIGGGERGVLIGCVSGCELIGCVHSVY